MDEYAPSLDEWQRRALASCVAPCRVSVVGAPGTGKTRLVGALVAREAQARIAVVTLDRRAAGTLHDEISMELGSLSRRVRISTLTGFAYSIVREYAQAVGRKDPELISGPDEDALLAEILADPDAQIEFPDYVGEELRRMRGFRSQIRDLVTRATELGYSPGELERLGRELGEPMWVAGAQVLDAYESLAAARDALAGSSDAPDRLDHAHIVGAATAILRGWEDNVASAPGAPRFSRPRWDWVVVDDVHNAPRSIVALLAELAADGASIVVTGDPDACVQGFRGAVASLPGDLARPVPRGLGCSMVALRQRHRAGESIGALAARITQATRVGGGAIEQRLPRAGRAVDSVRGLRFVHEEEESAWIAHALREAHLLDGLRYSDMAVMTRSRSAHPAIRAALVRRGIPVGQIAADRPLRDEPAVAALLALVRLARDPGSAGELRDVLTGPLIAIDPLRLRQIGRVLRGYELAAGGRRGEDELFALVLDGPEEVRRAAPVGAAELVQAAKVIAATRRASGQAEEVLWAAWSATGAAERWQEAALGGGIDADAADASLDAIIQLFRVAQRMADRDAEVGIDALIGELRTHDLPQDSIARAGSGLETVTLTTPSASIGCEWDFVIVAQMQEGLWPNMRLRDTHTHTSRLAQIASGREVEGAGKDSIRREAFEDVLDDELRQFHHAVTRTRRRLALTCVDGEDARPSRFFDLVGFVREEDFGADGRSGPILASPRPLPAELDVVTLAAGLRGLAARGGPDARSAASLLEELRVAGFPQAEPFAWAEPRDGGPDSVEIQPLLGDAEVRVSPSKAQTLLECPLRGFLSSVGGESSGGTAATAMGSLVHSIAERCAHGTKQEMLDIFEREWNALVASRDVDGRDYAHAREMVGLLADYLVDYRASGAEPAFVERPIRAEVAPGVVVSGKVDRLEPGPGGLTVVDFKTGKRVASKAEASDSVQLQLYQWAVERVEGRGASAGARLVFLGKLTKDGPAVRSQRKLDDAARERASERIRAVADILRSGQFAAVADEANCRNCRFSIVCPARHEGRLFS